MEDGIYLLLGSNLGDRLANLDQAKRHLGHIVASSSVYETAAWGNTNQGSFLNQVVQINSKLSPEKLLIRIQDVELIMGRKRIEKWGPRVIDIDILFYNDAVLKTTDLVIPHPEIQNRKFTLIPLLELTNKIHPVLKKTINQLLEECKDPLPVTRLQH